MDANFTNWVEIGTAHQCSDFHWWYWAYGSNDNFFVIGDQQIAPDGLNHSFYIDGTERDTPGSFLFEFKIDANDFSNYFWGSGPRGLTVSAGAESYNPNTVMPAHIYAQLAETHSEGPWTSWQAGPNEGYLVQGPMYGGFIDATTWQAGEN